jgi:hypothetical protein
MMGFLKNSSKELTWQRGLGLMFGGVALALVSRRFDDDATAIALLVPGIVLLMLAIAQLAKAAAMSSAQVEPVE